MRIAITSQNRKTVTDHAGKCRNFWLFDIESGQSKEKHLVELAIEETFHANHAQIAEPLAGIQMLITGGLGPGLSRRLSQMGIQIVVTEEKDPETVVKAFLSGTLVSLPINHEERCHHHAH